MQNKFSWISSTLAIVVLAIMVLWMAGIFDSRIAPGTHEPETPENQPTIQVSLKQHAIFEPVPASVEAKQATVISSRIMAQIDRINVRAGDMVTKGQVLIKLEDADLQSRVSQARANLQSVNTRLAEAKLSLSRATDMAAQKLIAKADLDRAQADYDTLVANAASASQRLREADSSLAFATITAPIDGRIVDRFAEPGDISSPGIQLLSLYNPVSLRVEANVREELAVKLIKGQPLDVEIPSLNKRLSSEVEELVPAGNVGSRSFLVKSRLGESTGLLPGMYARLLVPAGTVSTLSVPEQNIIKVGQLNMVWVITPDGIERRYIRIGKRYDDGMTEVISGLKATDQLQLAKP
jgi:membrane fusion protein (multidrug efflux system)